MFTSVEIKNFRGFRDLKLEPLGRVNLIAGKNNTGKTAVLEALYLHCHATNAAAAINVVRLRGVHDPQPDDVADWLFRNAATADFIEVATHESDGLTRTSRIRLANSNDPNDPDFGAIREWLNHFNPGYLSETNRTLVLKYFDSHGLDLLGMAKAVRTGTTFTYVLRNDVPTIAVVFLNSRDQIATTEMNPHLVVPAENLLFNQVDAEGRQEEIVGPLRLLEPRLERLSFNLFNGKPVIHGELAGVPRKVPLPLMGEGVRRVLLILSAIANAKGGVVLVDEMESGLHYSVLADVWRAIGEAARRLDVQFFATTHSWECIRTAHEAFSENGSYDLRLHRLDRIGEQVRAVTYNQRTLGTSVEMAMEVR